MNDNDGGLYVRSDTGAVITYAHYRSVINLIKILYFLNVITQRQVLDIATKFQSLFV